MELHLKFYHNLLSYVEKLDEIIKLKCSRHYLIMRLVEIFFVFSFVQLKDRFVCYKGDENLMHLYEI